MAPSAGGIELDHRRRPIDRRRRRRRRSGEKITDRRRRREKKWRRRTRGPTIWAGTVGLYSIRPNNPYKRREAISPRNQTLSPRASPTASSSSSSSFPHPGAPTLCPAAMDAEPSFPHAADGDDDEVYSGSMTMSPLSLTSPAPDQAPVAPTMIRPLRPPGMASPTPTPLRRLPPPTSWMPAVLFWYFRYSWLLLLPPPPPPLIS